MKSKKMKTKDEILDALEEASEGTGEDRVAYGVLVLTAGVAVLVDIRDLLAERFGVERGRMERIGESLREMTERMNKDRKEKDSPNTSMGWGVKD